MPGRRQPKRNSSAKYASLSSAVSRLNKEVNPSGTVRSAPPHPKAQRTSRHTWIMRKLRVMLYMSNSTPAVLTTALIVKAMNDTADDDSIIREFCVTKITAWNVTAPAQTTNFIRGRTYAAATTNGVEIYGEDFGTASSLPGVMFDIPDALSQLQKANGSSTTGLADFVPYPLGGDFTNKQTFVVDVHVRVLVL